MQRTPRPRKLNFFAQISAWRGCSGLADPNDRDGDERSPEEAGVSSGAALRLQVAAGQRRAEDRWIDGEVC